MAPESRTAVVAALLGNLALTVLKSVAAAFSGSAAMLAETLLSIALATIGLGLADRTGNVLWDAAASMAIGLVLLAVAVFLALENHSLLIGEAAPADVVAAVRARLAGDADVVSVLGVDTMHIGPDSVLVAARVRFRDELRAPEIVTAVRRLQDAAHEVLAGDTLRSMIVIEPGRPGDPQQFDAAA